MYAAIVLSCILMCCHGHASTETRTTLDKSDKAGILLDKRSDGLMAELVHLLVHQSDERKGILNRCNVTEDRVHTLNKDLDIIKQSVGKLGNKTATQQTDTQKQMKDIKNTMNDLARIVRKHSTQMITMQNQIHVLEKIIGM